MWATNIRIAAVGLIVIGFYTVVAHVIPQLESDVPEALDIGSAVTPEELVAVGEQVYNGAGGCVACHELGTRAPILLTDHGGDGPIGARCGARVAGLSCKEYLYQSLTEPDAFVVSGFESIMPDLSRQLPVDQVWAVIAFLQAQGGEVTVTADDIPSSEAPTGAVGGQTAAAPAFSETLDARQLITEKACIACHVLDGVGGPVGPPFDGIGARMTPAQIRRAILDPNADVADGYEQFAGTMPTNFGQQLSAAQLEALVQFLAARR